MKIFGKQLETKILEIIDELTEANDGRRPSVKSTLENLAKYAYEHSIYFDRAEARHFAELKLVPPKWKDETFIREEQDRELLIALSEVIRGEVKRR